MLTFFTSKSKSAGIDYSSLRTDMHSHLIPGIDDGARNIAQSLELIRAMIDMGFQKIIATPHVKPGYYPNTRETVYTGLNILREALVVHDISITVDVAAEYFLDESFEQKLDSGDILLLNAKYLLFELSFFNFPLNLFELIQKIIEKGYIPILAHPERYAYLHGSVDNYFKIRESGCLLQLNTISLTGYYGKSAQRIAEDLVNNNLIDFAGSDMHHIKHAEVLKQALFLPMVERLLNSCPLQNSVL